jgi:hypothetical protein
MVDVEKVIDEIIEKLGNGKSLLVAINVVLLLATIAKCITKWLRYL